MSDASSKGVLSIISTSCLPVVCGGVCARVFVCVRVCICGVCECVTYIYIYIYI